MPCLRAVSLPQSVPCFERRHSRIGQCSDTMKHDPSESRTTENAVDAWLAALVPSFADDTFVFVHVAHGRAGDPPLDVLVQAIASLRDDAGITYVLPLEAAQGAQLKAAFPCRRLELGVDTPLHGIGFLAVLLGALAAAGISVNPWAGYHRDTLFVPAERAAEACDVLQRLKREARSRLTG